MSIFKPSLRQRWRWWQWVRTRPRISQFISRDAYDAEGYRIATIRNEAKEPWPRKRYDWETLRSVWIFTPEDEALIDERLRRYGPGMESP